MTSLELLCSIRAAISEAISAIADNESLRADRDAWRSRYMEDLDRTIKHNDAMIGNVLLAMLGKSPATPDPEPMIKERP